MKSWAALNVVAALAFFAIAGGSASAITFAPDSNPAVAVSPAFGPLVAGGTAGTNYIDFGVDFSYGGQEGIFDDPPLAFGGVSSGGTIDLFSPVDGRIVLPGTLNRV